MLREQAEMRRRRQHLAALQALLATEGRSVYGDGVSTPAAISAAGTAGDPPPSRSAPAANPWAPLLAGLVIDAETEVPE